MDEKSVATILENGQSNNNVANKAGKLIRGQWPATLDNATMGGVRKLPGPILLLQSKHQSVTVMVIVLIHTDRSIN